MVAYLLLSLLVACILTHHEYGGSGIPDTPTEPSRGVISLMLRNTEEGRCLLENPKENSHEGWFVVVVVVPAAQVLWLSCHVVEFSNLWATDISCCTVREGFYGSQVQHAVRHCCALLLRTHGWVVALLVIVVVVVVVNMVKYRMMVVHPVAIMLRLGYWV